jgi:hypothetical protein
MKITISLILINILIFLVSLSDLDYYVENYGFVPARFLSGNYELIITSIFLHASFMHLFLNMVALLFIGGSLEKELKGWVFLLIYLVSGILGNLAMLLPFLYSRQVIGVGASGAISGLVGTGTFLCPGCLVFFESILPIPFVLAGVLYFLTTIMNLFVPSEIAYPVHFIGLIIGFIFGISLVERKKRRRNVLIFIFVLLLVVLLPYIWRMII